jgi:23S rRNA (cytidine1920-2'-O)/16S rRNA (cytidine1409-2'-O)-methyltransferase
MPEPDPPYVSRGALKMAHALDAFGIDPAGRICADLGCSTGGFTDVLLRRGAAKVYAVDTGYGVLDWRLRNDPRVVAMERTNAMHVELPERVSMLTIDAGWTRQSAILPRARTLVSASADVVTLIKPHYEVDRRELNRTRGVLPAERLPEVLERVLSHAGELGFVVIGHTPSPIRGSGGRGNLEVLVHLRPLTP